MPASAPPSKPAAGGSLDRPRASVLIGAYRDTVALAVLLGALVDQTEPPDEVVIAEDGACPEVARFVAEQKGLPFTLLHTSGPDTGWTKNTSLNRAIRASSGELLLFLDEDCPPFPGWVAAHRALAAPGRVLCGRRVDVGPGFSARLRSGELSAAALAKGYLRRYRALAKDGGRHLEEGLAVPAGGALGRWTARWRKKVWLVGCNWSCQRADLLAINGFDEDFDEPCYGEDIDLERRFRLLGLEVLSARNLAPVFHLDHAKRFDQGARDRMQAVMASRPDSPRCLNGIQDERVLAPTP